MLLPLRWVLVASALGAGLMAQAQDPNALRRLIESRVNQIEVEWVTERNGPAAHEPQIETGTDGEILLTRRPKEGDPVDFTYIVERIARWKGEVQTRVKSTTCPNVRADMLCKFEIQWPIIATTVKNLDDENAKPRETSFGHLDAGLAFAKKHFPELVDELSFKLSCPRWNWIQKRSPMVRVVDIGSTFDRTNPDLNINNPGQVTTFNVETCSRNNCDLSKSFLGDSISMFLLISDEFAWHMDIQQAGKSCTVEFLSLPPPDLTEQIEKDFKEPWAKLNTPELLASIKQRINPQVAEEWVKAKLSSEASLGEFDPGGSADELYALLKYPFLSMLEMVRGDGSVTGKNGLTKVKFNDRFDEKDEN